MKSTTATPEQLVEIGVKKGQFPQYLYKFRALSSNTENIIINGEIWFPSPKDFNDPFDCQITVDSQNTIQEIEAYLIKNSMATSQTVKAVAQGIITNRKRWHQTINAAANKVINSKGICCFAANHEHTLMWSHYADGHKGICLKFDVLKDPTFFVFPLNMAYTDNYPEYNHLTGREELTDKLIKTKSNCWSYEQEVRVLKDTNGLHKFNKEALVEIIFGCNCSDSDINKIKDLVSKNGYHNMSYKKAIKHDSRYELTFVSI